MKFLSAIYKSIFLFLFFLVSNSSFAFDGVTVNYLGIEQGLSNNAVTCIYQDHNGFMWFGTYDGLNRYDGYSFKIFRNIIGDSSSLGDNHIYSIAADADHNLWVGSVRGVSIYNPAKDNFHFPSFRPWNQSILKPAQSGVGIIKAIHGGGLMLIGTQEDGLLVFEKSNQPGIQIPLRNQAGKQVEYSVTAIEYDPAINAAWIIVRQMGLYLYDVKTRSLRLISAEIKTSNCLKEDASGNLWLGNENGLFNYNTRNNTYSPNSCHLKMWCPEFLKIKIKYSGFHQMVVVSGTCHKAQIKHCRIYRKPDQCS